MARRSPDLRDFLAVNRFLLDAITNPNNSNLDQVAGALLISAHSLRNYLLKWSMPTSIRNLKKRVADLLLSPLPPPPAIYQMYYMSDQSFDDQSLELLRPLTEYHFDYKYIVLPRFPVVSPERLALFAGPWTDAIPFDYDWDAPFFPDSASREFRATLCRHYANLLAFLRDLSNDECFKANADLSVAFLHGAVSFPTPGISSPHLTGSFLLGLRKANTGYLSVNCDCPAAVSIGQARWHDIVAWFRANNPLYSDVNPITPENLEFRLEAATATVAAIQIPGSNPTLTDASGQVCLTVRNDDGTTSRKHLPLEVALALAFPILFPYGLPEIPAKTLRKKARLILASHPYYRCGRLQCHLALFLYHIIQDYAISFHRTKLSLQPVNLPDGANRLIDSPPTFVDPSSPAYWNARQAEVRAMCQQFGDPDLMLTLTFVNKWPEVASIESALRETLAVPLDLRFCPLETMMVWKYRFSDIKTQDFRQLMTMLGFPAPIHYTWRLEFQSRGAPHVHALIWLADRLSLSCLTRRLFASVPPLHYPQLRNLVTQTMIHGCTTPRCNRGDPNRPCRYGFPKPSCARASVDEQGCLHLPRSSSDKWVVDYSPALLWKWHGHAHIHILRTAEHDQCSPNALFYVTKYNFKNEPSLRVDVRQEDTYATLFNARIVSSEEALARIFSFDFHGSSSTFEYLSLQPPESRSAAFVAGLQVQVPDVEKYFLRPASLDRLSILSFFSLYEISADKDTNEDRQRHLPDDTFSCLHRNRPP